jgi:hypothetical protein
VQPGSHKTTGSYLGDVQLMPLQWRTSYASDTSLNFASAAALLSGFLSCTGIPEGAAYIFDLLGSGDIGDVQEKLHPAPGHAEHIAQDQYTPP